MKNLTKDRLIRVQNAASDALRSWQKFQEALQSIEDKKKKRDLLEFNPDNLIKMRTGIDVNQPLEDNIEKLAANIEVITNEKIVIDKVAITNFTG